MRIKFPNPFGYQLPAKARVDALCKNLPVPADYQRFLLTQNGLDLSALSESTERQRFMEQWAEPTHCPDLRALFGLDSGNEFHDLEAAIEGDGTFGGLLLPIGASYGGDSYVLVLAGKYTGCVASLDHEMHAGSDSAEAFAAEFEIDGFDEMTPDERADALLDEDLGLAWLHAPSMSAFLEACVHCDERYCGYVMDHPSRADHAA